MQSQYYFDHKELGVRGCAKNLGVGYSTLTKIESFHALIKREWLNRFKIRDYQQVYRLIFEYVEAFYNTKRIHSHCGYMSPDDFEKLYEQTQTNELLLNRAAAPADSNAYLEV